VRRASKAREETERQRCIGGGKKPNVRRVSKDREETERQKKSGDKKEIKAQKKRGNRRRRKPKDGGRTKGGPGSLAEHNG